MSCAETIKFKASYWNFETDSDSKNLVLHICGRTIDDNGENKTVYCKVIGFEPYVYVQLPTRIKWDDKKLDLFIEHFKDILKSDAPTKNSKGYRFRLHYHKRINVLILYFKNNEDARKFANMCMGNKNTYIRGLGSFAPKEFLVHEHNIDPIIKFTAKQDISLASWIQAKPTVLQEEEEFDIEDRKFACTDIDLYAHWKDVFPATVDSTKIVRYKYFSFDIECYSVNHNSKLPDPQVDQNLIFQIGITVGYFGDSRDERKRYLLSLWNPLDIKGIEITRCKDERDLLLKFKNMIVDIDPDAFVGYNIMKFDWNYIIERATLLGIYDRFRSISRIIGERAEKGEIRWSSSAYNEQIFKYLSVNGRSNVDVLIEIERNFKFPKYSLDYVSEHFLKEHKKDVTPRQLFMLVQLTQEMTPIVEKLPDDEIINRKKRISLKKHIISILPLRRSGGVLAKYRKDLLNAKRGDEFKRLIRKAMTITGKYCSWDTILPIDLCNKLNLWTSMEEMSNCMNVPMSYLHTRGQQIKVLAQIYRETNKNKIIIPVRIKDPKEVYEKFQGAIVIEANPGFYRNVVCFDFESLYPTTIIANNICYTTLVEENDPIPDDQCHVLAWPEHKFCPHDPSGKKAKKKKDIRCKDHRYRFKKVTFKPDGTKENEGLLPRLLRNLLISRKRVKKEMAKAEATYKMATGVATEEDIDFFRKCGYTIIEKGSLSKQQLDVLKVFIIVLNAQQLALKVSANSGYGALGAQTGFIPLVEGAASTTAMGREYITKTIKYILANYPNARLVYGDTDSSMIRFEGLDTAESFAMGDRVSKQVSHYLKSYILGFDENFTLFHEGDGKHYKLNEYPRSDTALLSDENKILILQYDNNPINLQFENLYQEYFLLTKKRYLAHAVNRKGEIVAKIKKGVVTARRDNSQYLRDTYTALTDTIMKGKPDSELYYILYDRINALFTRQIQESHLIIYMGIKTVIGYADKEKEEEDDKGNKIKNPDRKFIDENGEIIEEPNGPLDPRLVYKNLPQVLLALKMLRRGDDVPANTRLEFLYIENPLAEHQGDKAEDYTFYRENKNLVKPRMKPDYLTYVDKMLQCITELFSVKIKNQVQIPYEKHEQALERCISRLDDLQRGRVINCKTFEKIVSANCNSEISNGKNKRVYIGWEAICKKCRLIQKSKADSHCAKHRPNVLPERKYRYKGDMAKIQYILESSRRKRKNEIDINEHRELVNVATNYKSFEILNRVSKHFGGKKRTLRAPNQHGEKLRVTIADEPVKVMITRNIDEYKRGDIGELIAREEEERKTSRKRKEYDYYYDIRMKNGEILKSVPRRDITTFRIRDAKMMTDIYNYRYYWKEVVEQINEIFSKRFVYLDDEENGEE